MAGRKTLTVSLTTELDAFVSRMVDSGRYVSASEVVREGLRIVEDRESRREAQIARLREQIAVGLRQVEAGDTVDGEEFFDELLRRMPKATSAG